MNPETDKLLAIVLILVISMTGCSSTGAKTSFLQHNRNGADNLATYKDNAEATKADGDITPPSKLAKSSATAELARHRLADSGYPVEQLYGSGYEKPGTKQLADQQRPNYTAAEEMVHQSNVQAEKGQTPVAYRSAPDQPPAPNSVAASAVPPMVSTGTTTDPSVNPYKTSTVSESGALPAVPDLPSPAGVAASATPAVPESPVAGNAGSLASSEPSSAAVPSFPSVPQVSNVPAMPETPAAYASTAAIPASEAAVAQTLPSGSGPINEIAPAQPANPVQDSQVMPVGFISEQEVKAYQTGQSSGVFLPGSLNSSRFDEFNSGSPNASPAPKNLVNPPSQPNPTNPPIPNPAGNPVPGCVLPGFSFTPSAHDDAIESAVDEESVPLSPLGIPEAAFCSMSYHEVAQLVYQMTGQNPELVQNNASSATPFQTDGLRQDASSQQNIPIVQTAFVNRAASVSPALESLPSSSFTEVTPVLLDFPQN